MPDTALVVMARYPKAGKTKTRLARAIGDVLCFVDNVRNSGRRDTGLAGYVFDAHSLRWKAKQLHLVI